MLERPLGVPAESNSELEVVVEQKIVRGDAAKGMRPYVCIGRKPEAIGQKLIVQIDARDMRTVRGHLESGEDVGILTASKAWSGHCHSRTVRRAMNSILAARALEIPKSEDPIEALVLYKREQLAK